MDIRYNLSQLFETAFGVASPVYLTVPLSRQRPAEIIYETPKIKPVELEEAVRKSRMGTPVIFPIKFKGGDYKVYDQNAKVIHRHYTDFYLPPATLVDFSRAKNITRTEVLGSNGSVKEIFGFEDWSIRIRTLCMLDELSAREYEKTILDFEKIAASIEVEGDLFGWKGIHNLVIENVDIKSLPGSPNVIPIELSCSSDEPFELILKNNP